MQTNCSIQLTVQCKQTLYNQSDFIFEHKGEPVYNWTIATYFDMALTLSLFTYFQPIKENFV